VVVVVRQIRALVLTLVAAGVLVGAAAGAASRPTNCGGLCLYTSNASGGWGFAGQFARRSNHAPAAKPWLRLSNTVNWKLTLTPKLAKMGVSQEIRLGTPARPGKVLAVLCRRCHSGSHGLLWLSDQSLGAIFAGTQLGSSQPVHAYVVLHAGKHTLSRRLLDA
jgi:hypothetical protein